MSDNLTLMDIAREFGPDGTEYHVAEILSEQNSILDDMPFIECNDGSTNKGAVRTGLPKGTWRKLYQGVQQEKGTTANVQDACGMLETFSRPDCDIIDKAPNKAAALLRESRAFLDGISNSLSNAIFYGDVAIHPEKIQGLSSRYISYGTDKKKSSYNVINAGGTGSDNTSIWLISWGTDRITGLYPRGSKAGLTIEDDGKQTVNDSDGNPYKVYQTHYKWDVGFSVLDWRYASRIANIDVSALINAGDTGYAGANIINLLVDAMYRIPAKNKGREHVKVYCNDTVAAALTKLAINKSTLALGIKDVMGEPVTTFWGHPIKPCDGILNTEAALPAA